MEPSCMSYGWEGRKVRLVPLDKDRHFDNCVRWINDPDVTQWTLMGDFPLTRVAEEHFFDRMTRPNETDVVFAIETLKEEHIGLSGIHEIGRIPARWWKRGAYRDAVLVVLHRDEWKP